MSPLYGPCPRPLQAVAHAIANLQLAEQNGRSENPHSIFVPGYARDQAVSKTDRIIDCGERRRRPEAYCDDQHQYLRFARQPLQPTVGRSARMEDYSSFLLAHPTVVATLHGDSTVSVHGPHNEDDAMSDPMCAAERRRFPVCVSPTRQLLQPKATGAVMEETKWLKPSVSVSRIGDSASVQAVTRVNAEQTSKRTMRRPTRPLFRGRLIRLGE